MFVKSRSAGSAAPGSIALLCASLVVGYRQDADLHAVEGIAVEGVRSWQGHIGDKVDLGPLFQLTPGKSTHSVGGTELKCCCRAEGDCSLGEVRVDSLCKQLGEVVDHQKCGCVVGMGYSHYAKFDTGCIMTVADALTSLARLHPRYEKMAPDDLLASVAEARATRLAGGWRASYGECSASCGRGTRRKEREVCAADECGPPGQTPEEIGCQELGGCHRTCEAAATCGWGKVGCSGSQKYCDLRAANEAAFPTELTFGFFSCFKACDEEQALQSLCAVTANHLDEQYGSVDALVKRTCFSDAGPALWPTARPDVVVLMTQELNHGGTLTGSNDFPKYVTDRSLPGYSLAGVCAPDMSANSAVYIKEHLSSHIFRARAHCSGNLLRSKCSWTNCKGSSVLSLASTSGRLVVANWHGERAGTESRKRVHEFERAAEYISTVAGFLGRKHVVFGGDTNVRSDLDPGTWPRLLEGGEATPREFMAATRGGDVLGVPGWTLDQHLRGEVGFDPLVKGRLRSAPLRQAEGWDRLCPTYQKTTTPRFERKYKEWDGTKNWMGMKNYANKVEQLPNLQCRAPAGQMADGETRLEYLSAARPDGKKSGAPSWTERIFLTEELFAACGEAKKDVRNTQTDHDPMFVECSIPYAGPQDPDRD